MTSIRATARDAFTLNKNRVRAPEWFPKVGLIIGAIFTIFIVVQVIIPTQPSSSKGVPNSNTANKLDPKFSPSGNTSVEEEDKMPGTPSSIPTSDSTTDTQGTITLKLASGESVVIPQAALDAAIDNLRSTISNDVLIITQTVQANKLDQEIIFAFTITSPSSVTPKVEIRTVTKNGSKWQVK
jgi:hypothetical protein